MPRLATTRVESPSVDEVELEATVPVLTGTYFHALDDKGRIIIPAKLRPALTERFWVMLDENDNVALYDYKTGRDILEYCERLMGLHPGDDNIAAAVERITGAAEEITVDKETWRVAISEVLRFQAKLEKEVVTVGVLNKAVLTSRSAWEKSMEERIQSEEVKRAQARMLRAAASGQKVEQSVPGATGADSTGNEREKAASSGDGRRGNQLLTLSQVGR